MTIKTEVKGQRELFKKLEEIPAKLAKKALRKGTRKAAQITAHVAQALAPVDEGDLDASIKVRAGKRSRVRIEHQAIAGTEVEAGEAFHAGFVNFGTKYMEADWYMTQAFETTYLAGQQAVITETRRELQKLGPGLP